MSFVVSALVALALRSPPSPLNDDTRFPSGLDPTDVLSPSTREASDEDRRSLYGQLFHNLVTIEDLAVIVHAGGLDAIRDRYEGPATITVSGTLMSPFDSEVRNVEVQVAFFPADQAKRAWHRLNSSPLVLTDAELQEKLPRPSFSLDRPVLGEHAPSLRSSMDIRVETEFDSLELIPRVLPGYLAILTDYTLDNPTANDVALIIQQGGTTDLIALADWAGQLEPRSVPFEEADRARVMSTLGERLRTLRAPPALGDLQRLNTMLLLVRSLADAHDLEFLLGLDRSMRIMLTSAALSYYDALIEENFIELPIHGVQSLPSSSREFIHAYRYALQDVRRKSLARLLELAHDPLDFRDAPPSVGLTRSPVQPQAAALLRPLSPTNVTGLLDAAEDNVATQRDILRYYIRAHHAPAVEPLLRWLLDHPGEYETLGVFAANELGSLIVPALIRYYFDPNDPEQRTLARKLLLKLDDKTAADVVEIIRSTGVLLPQGATITQALAKFDERQEGELRRDATELENEAFNGGDDVLSLSARLQAVQRLGTIAPDRLRRRSDETIALLSKAAIALDTDSPAESDKALSLLESLQLDRGVIPQLEAVTLARSRIAIGRREFESGLEILEDYDEEAQNPRVLQLYLETVARRVDMLIGTGNYARAHELLERGKARYGDAPVLLELESRLFIAQYWPALALGGLFGLTVLGTGGWLGYRGVRRGLANWRDAKRRANRLRRREDHAKRAAAELERLASEAQDESDGGVVSLAIERAVQPVTSVISADEPLESTQPVKRVDPAATAATIGRMDAEGLTANLRSSVAPQEPTTANDGLANASKVADGQSEDATGEGDGFARENARSADESGDDPTSETDDSIREHAVDTDDSTPSDSDGATHELDVKEENTPSDSDGATHELDVKEENTPSGDDNSTREHGDGDDDTASESDGPIHESTDEDDNRVRDGDDSTREHRHDNDNTARDSDESTREHHDDDDDATNASFGSTREHDDVTDTSVDITSPEEQNTAAPEQPAPPGSATASAAIAIEPELGASTSDTTEPHLAAQLEATPSPKRELDGEPSSHARTEEGGVQIATGPAVDTMNSDEFDQQSTANDTSTGTSRPEDSDALAASHGRRSDETTPEEAPSQTTESKNPASDAEPSASADPEPPASANELEDSQERQQTG